jgi:transcriptional regulator with XRE-family HTH domain
MNEARSIVNHFIGMRIRERRMIMGLNQHQFGELIGVTYQQVHKYERGTNSVSAGRLYEAARELSTPIEYFFDGLEKSAGQQMPPRQRRLLDFVRNFGAIRNEKYQEAISQTTRALAGH